MKNLPTGLAKQAQARLSVFGYCSISRSTLDCVTKDKTEQDEIVSRFATRLGFKSISGVLTITIGRIQEGASVDMLGNPI